MKKENIRSLSLIFALVLILGSMIGGTIAWLIATSDTVVNTFTYGDINLTLTESDTGIDGDGNVNTNKYKMVPGQTITKDPVVTVAQGSEEMWLFVKLEKSANFDDFMTYEVDTSWAPLDGVDGVYYRHIPATEVAQADMTVHVLKDDTVTVKDEVTKEMLNALDAAGGTGYPTLNVTAYAVQHAGSTTAAEAWVKINPPANP